VDWVLRPLAVGLPARWQRYEWSGPPGTPPGRPGDWAELLPADFVVVEGCCVGLPAAAAYLSYLVWVDTQPAQRRLRLERRDDWNVYEPFASNWARQESALQAGARTAERADVIVDNSAPTADGGWPDQFAVRTC
jgi:hypothetical protein